MLLFFLILCVGCSSTSKEVATISVNSDSDYTNTFQNLNLGLLYDFNFKLNQADERWVKLWVEKYNNGKKESQPLTELYYGNNPQEVEEGNLGFGIINTDSDDYLVFLYGPGVSMRPSYIVRESSSGIISSSHTFNQDDDIHLELDETKILAAYNETENSVASSVGLQDEEAVKKLIEEGNMVLLLKIRIEDKTTNHN